MEPGKGDSPKLPDMVMCGDHPSITTGEVCLGDKKQERKEKSMSSAKITPTPSQIEEENREVRSCAVSEHTLRLVEARRRVRSIETMRAETRSEDAIGPGNRALVQAALGSFRWPPYLVAVWVLVLLLTHALHCLVAVLERALPSVRKCCQYFRSWAEESWRAGGEAETSRFYPLGLATATGLLYAFYYGLYAAYCLAVWAVEPLLTDEDKRDVETKVTNYLDEVNSKTNTSSKH